MIVKDDYMKLLRRFPLVPIETRLQHKAAIKMSLELGKKGGSKTSGERDYYRVLAMLISDYETHRTITYRPISPQDLLKFLMEEHGLKQVDIGRIIGYESHVSAFLKGNRNLSKTEALKLGDYFAVDPIAFLPMLEQFRRKKAG